MIGNGMSIDNEVDFEQREPVNMFGNHGFGSLFEKAAHEENPLNSAYRGFRGF